jgi:hypothetical protein
LPEQAEIGRVLSAGTAGFVAGCRVKALETPSFGALVRVPVDRDSQIYGLIHDIRIQDDGLVRQLVTAEGVSEEVVLDNRERRIVPVEMSVVVVGCRHAGSISYQLPPRPPLSLDPVYGCAQVELRDFISAGHFGYFRHLIRVPDLPLGELLAAHIRQAAPAHSNPEAWRQGAVDEVIALLRDDYPLLAAVLAAIDPASSAAIT